MQIFFQKKFLILNLIIKCNALIIREKRVCVICTCRKTTLFYC